MSNFLIFSEPHDVTGVLKRNKIPAVGAKI